MNRQFDRPVFNINRQTNSIIRDRRLKLKSVRQKNFEYLVRQMKLEGSDTDVEYDGVIAIEEKMKEVEDVILNKKLEKKKVEKLNAFIVFMFDIIIFCLLFEFHAEIYF